MSTPLRGVTTTTTTIPIIEKRKASEKTPTTTVLLGQSHANFPTLSIFARDNNGKWCHNVRIKEGSKSTKKYNNWNNDELYMFSNEDRTLKRCTQIYEHSDIVIFTPYNESNKLDYEFGFSIDNSSSPSNKFAILYVFSNQQEDMVFRGFVAPPGEITELIRYGDSDCAFTLNRSQIKAKNLKSAKIINEEMGNTVCSFKLLLTPMEKRITALRAMVDSMEEDKVDYVNDDYEMDGSGDNDQLYHTNLFQGGETKQDFNYIHVDYKNDPVHIFDVTILFDSKK